MQPFRQEYTHTQGVHNVWVHRGFHYFTYLFHYFFSILFTYGIFSSPDSIAALSKERMELILLIGREGWFYRRIAEEFNL